MQVPISAFFEMDEAAQTVVFQQTGHRPRAAFAHGMAEDLGAGMTLHGGQPLLVTLRPGADSGSAPIVHTGHEFVYCLEGQLTYTIDEPTLRARSGRQPDLRGPPPPPLGKPRANPDRARCSSLCPDDENDRPTEKHFATKAEARPPRGRPPEEVCDVQSRRSDHGLLLFWPSRSRPSSCPQLGLRRRRHRRWRRTISCIACHEALYVNHDTGKWYCLCEVQGPLHVLPRRGRGGDDRGGGAPGHGRQPGALGTPTCQGCHPQDFAERLWDIRCPRRHSAPPRARR